MTTPWNVSAEALAEWCEGACAGGAADAVLAALAAAGYAIVPVEQAATKFHDILTAADVEYSAMSWSGFNVFGEAKSIQHVRGLVERVAAFEVEVRELRKAQQQTWYRIDDPEHPAPDEWLLTWGTCRRVWMQLGGLDDGDITHWRPLPAPPAPEE